MSEIRERAEKMVAENPANNGKCKYMPLFATCCRNWSARRKKYKNSAGVLGRR